jgi:hypothetical protein
VGKFVLGWLALGLAVNLGMEACVVRPGARSRLEQPIRPVRLDNAEVGSALQDVADSTKLPIHLSMCPDLSSSRVTLTTPGPMPLEQFLLLVAGRVGAQVDLTHARHGIFAEPSPHLYFARAPCGNRSFVSVHSRAK